MSSCKYCGATIIWIDMASGKHMPCNDGQLPYRKNKDGAVKLVTKNGEVISADLVADEADAEGIGYISHYATCPGAERFRRR